LRLAQTLERNRKAAFPESLKKLLFSRTCQTPSHQTPLYQLFLSPQITGIAYQNAHLYDCRSNFRVKYASKKKIFEKTREKRGF
jgi:hypothetical protein